MDVSPLIGKPIRYMGGPIVGKIIGAEFHRHRGVTITVDIADKKIRDHVISEPRSWSIAREGEPERINRDV